MIEIIYIVIAILSFYMSYDVREDLHNVYFSEQAKSSGLFTHILPLAILFPKPFFKKKVFLKGYLTYLLHLFLLSVGVVFLVMGFKAF